MGVIIIDLFRKGIAREYTLEQCISEMDKLNWVHIAYVSVKKT